MLQLTRYREHSLYAHITRTTLYIFLAQVTGAYMPRISTCEAVSVSAWLYTGGGYSHAVTLTVALTACRITRSRYLQASTFYQGKTSLCFCAHHINATAAYLVGSLLARPACR